ncbi:hypothetical protein OAL13_00245 [bacterium]|nr:hypothetical protein [bacterium]
MTKDQLCCVQQALRKGISDKYEAAHYMLNLDDSLYLQSDEVKTWEGMSFLEVVSAIDSYFNNNNDQQTY